MLCALALAAASLAACGAPIKPFEVLDEQTGMTVGTLDKPIELLQALPPSASAASSERRASYAYLGPVEWDNMGNISYGLWIHLAPGNDWRFEDIEAPGAVSLSLDGTPLPLSIIHPPVLARAPYRPVASWGETAYFGVDLDLLKRMAASGKIGLDLKVGNSVVHFAAGPDAPETLTRYLHARGY